MSHELRRIHPVVSSKNIGIMHMQSITDSAPEFLFLKERLSVSFKHIERRVENGNGVDPQE